VHALRLEHRAGQLALDAVYATRLDQRAAQVTSFVQPLAPP
jgi:hypothetical protein